MLRAFWCVLSWFVFYVLAAHAYISEDRKWNVEMAMTLLTLNGYSTHYGGHPILNPFQVVIKRTSCVSCTRILR
jgi:hypothetical protein